METCRKASHLYGGDLQGSGAEAKLSEPKNMSSISLRNITKVYPITKEEIKSAQKLAKKRKEAAPVPPMNLQITEDGVLAVNDFSLEIADGEFVVLVGPSGCGKSTTLRMIAGLEEITDGYLFIGDKLSNSIAPKDRNIAMVFQNYALYPHMSVYDNMAFSLKLAKVPREEMDRKVKEVAKILDITEYLDRFPKALSGGQRQRVAIGRAIVRNPEVLLMDEPLSNLDAKLRGQMRSEIIKLRSKIQTTFVYVTHDQVEAMTLGDRIVVMKDGVIQQVGTPQEVFNNPKNVFVAGFIGTPQINFFHNCELKKVDGKYTVFLCGKEYVLPDKQQKILNKKEQKDDNIIVAVRPVHIHLADEGIKGIIEVSEMMGSEIHLHINTNGDDIVAVIPTANLDFEKMKIGNEITYDFDARLLHLFDTETQKSLLIEDEE